LTDHPKVLDFGLAKITETQLRPGSIQLTQEGMVFGTPEFMSPEQAQGKFLDARSDIYSLSVILYEMLTGKLPFVGQTPMDYLQKHVLEPPIPIATRAPDLPFPQGLDAVIRRALAKAPDQRYRSAIDFAAALRPYAQEIPLAPPGIVAATTPSGRPTESRSDRGQRFALLAAVAGVFLLVGVAVAVVVLKFVVK
jgi:serine/threonine-protein kinase